jgi:hypothetical protein
LQRKAIWNSLIEMARIVVLASRDFPFPNKIAMEKAQLCPISRLNSSVKAKNEQTEQDKNET